MLEVEPSKLFRDIFPSDFLSVVVYLWVSIVRDPLAHARRVKYTSSMIWKFKKSEAATPVPQPTPIPEGGSAGEAKSPIVTSVKVENQDAALERPSGAFVIPGGYRISGLVVTGRHVVVEGELHGSGLVAPSVHVGGKGVLNAPTQATKVTVCGVVESPVAARDYIEVRQGGVIKNDVEAGGLCILPGGLVSGARLSIGPLRAQS